MIGKDFPAALLSGSLLKFDNTAVRELANLGRGATTCLKQPLEHCFDILAIFRKKIQTCFSRDKIDPNVGDGFVFEIRSIGSVAVGERGFCIRFQLSRESYRTISLTVSDIYG